MNATVGPETNARASMRGASSTSPKTSASGAAAAAISTVSTKPATSFGHRDARGTAVCARYSLTATAVGAASISTLVGCRRGARVARLGAEPFFVRGFVRRPQAATQHLGDHRVEIEPPFEIVRPQEHGVAGHVGEP